MDMELLEVTLKMKMEEHHNEIINIVSKNIEEQKK